LKIHGEVKMSHNNPCSFPESVKSQFRKAQAVRLFLLLILASLASHAFGQTLTTLHDFGAFRTDGRAPGSGVIIDSNGNLFGTTGVGGSDLNGGTVFELSPPAVAGDPWTETVLRRFRGTPDGKIPLSRLVMTSNDVLFGTTLRGGVNDLGVAYMMSPPSKPGVWKEKVIHDFGTVPDDVVSPDLGLFAAPEGFYGADQGGANNTGAVYLLTPAAHGTYTQNILYSFQGFGSPDGALPSGELTRDSNGNFYGVTALGGINNLGAVYEVSPPAIAGNSWTETVLYSFNGTDGTLPAGKLLLGSAGQLFGTTNGGGSGEAGTVFELDPPKVPGNPWTHKIVYAFTGGSDGTSPENGVISDGSGRLFGTAADTIFMLTPPHASSGKWKETVLHTFSGPDGFTISGPLTLSNHALYGTTSQAGAFGAGTAFQLTLP
jgi:uncharacterized repeat protein (TIGR03803 family)